MAGLDTAARVVRYLRRQNAWFESVLAELEGIADVIEADTLEAFLAGQARRAAETETLAREHHALLREWQACEVATDAERAAVKQLAVEAEDLNQRLVARYEAAVAVAGRSRAAGTEAMTRLRQGRDLLEKYRPGGAWGPGLLDKNA